SALSPNQAFKRPLPPSEASPFVETKRPKTYVGTPRLAETFTLPCLKPLPMSAFNASPSQETATRTDGSSSPPSLECQQSDASPELPVSRTAAPEKSRLIPRSESSYSLVTRQSSVPVTSSDSIDASIVRETPLCKTLSESHLSIMKALNKCHNREEELTGDFCRSLSLPVISCGRNPDIKSITPETVAQLIHGEYSHLIESYQILDCRYPYEFEGGHIKGAESWHNPQFVVDYIDKAERVMPPTPTDPNKRHILIFHCEFSAERGPKAQRLLRERDRTVNKDRYPALHFPETYLLEGGYKAFFELYPSLCVPQKYTKMLDTNHAEDLKLCRARSKSWAVENKHGKGRSGLWSKRFNRDT
ncbi:M-phase inducer phosphatase-like, partial [Hyalella azteca]|uniref:M-phase inducer phosphatase n=1 Tax=Hyalella azteca TaxID=294128 RepID=A0A8B7NW39_HYAAZ